MQNPQQHQQQMAAMAAMSNNVGGPVNGTPLMGNLQRPGPQGADPNPQTQLNTYIYDYFMRNKEYQLARAMLKDSNLEVSLQPKGARPSPSGRAVNGIDSMDGDDPERGDLQHAAVPGHAMENSFLSDWWGTFWDIFRAARSKDNASGKANQYINHTRNIAQMQNDNRNNRMMMTTGNMNPAQYQNMMRSMAQQNGMAPNDLKRAAAINNRNPNGANPMANMQNKPMMSAQMQRDGSGMDMNGQRPQSPGSAENAPSPNKRPRVEGGMNGGNMANQFSEYAQPNVQQKSIEGMNAAVHNSPMNHQGLEGSENMFAGNGAPRPGMPGGTQPGGQPGSNHALQDYQMQLMLLEQQNKKRLLMARQEQDSMSGGPHNQQGVGGPGFPQSMSPQGSRAGPSPNPTDQMKRGTPKLNQQGLPGSPMPDASMQPQRNSPAPGNMGFDPSQMPPGYPPQYASYPQNMQNPMMRPPSSHPNNLNPQQLSQQQQQMEAMRQGGMPNGVWQRGPGGPGMMPQGQQMGGPMSNPAQRNPMPPPPAPPNGEQPRPQEPSPSQSTQAPPTPNTTNKANPKKKATKDNKASKAKGATGATPAASSEDPPPTPTPSTPITPMHQNSFNQKGQQGGQPAQPQPPAQQQPPMDNNVPPFGNINDEPNFDLGGDGFGPTDTLETFDFDSFLHVGDDSTGFGSLGNDFGFGDLVEASDAL